MSTRTPSYRLHRASGQAVVTLSGRDHYLGKFGSTASKAEYERLTSEWLRNGRHLDPGRDLSVAELVRDYMTIKVDVYYRKDGEPTSEVKCIRDALKPLLRLYGHTRAAEFRPSSLETVRNAFIEAGNCRN